MNEQISELEYTVFNEYDCIVADELNELGFANSSDHKISFYGEVYDERVMMHLNSGNMLSNGAIGHTIPYFQYKRTMLLMNDRYFNPSRMNKFFPKEYKDFLIQSKDVMFNRKCPDLVEESIYTSFETLIENEIMFNQYKNFRYYEHELNSTSLQMCKTKEYNSYYDVDWSEWCVLYAVGLRFSEENKNNLIYSVIGVPKFMFSEYRKKGILDWKRR